ncbi:NUD22-like protein [Mya arenaria]|uniref:NUD22-like protein n=1 Tax=Mya arenaria TaxID=6604 RepID=A0ABY7FDA7_MYAAR|nr:uridine diphosphate glucose pyrophosphatase NUDT22-like [Mya arenaria]XP_052766754.1 uridine diphosphate glucose pyrophosphatase NUDT22-like [Mya arenaria]WAR20133.1 NUD22-like protein [Mya arenaria]
MDPFTVIYTTRSPSLTLPENIHVNLSPSFNRQTLPGDQERDIDKHWQDRLVQLPSLFNGTKFRLDSLEDNKSGDLNLNLGVTCYKDFQGTNLSQDVLLMQSQGLCDHDNSQAYLSDALGVGAFVLTADDHMVLLFRSQNCGEDVNLWDRPGGHAEPKALVGNIPMEDIKVENMDPEKVIKELFSSIIEEVVSEVNIPAESLQPPGILGIHRSNLNGGKPNVEFLVRCKLTSEEVEREYAKGSHSEAYESERILLLPMGEALSSEATKPELWAKMAAGAKATVTLYKMYRHRFPEAAQ